MKLVFSVKETFNMMSNKYLVTLCLGFLFISSAAGESPKIVGGVETTIEDVPYQLELENGLLGIFWSFSCGAVIVGPNSVLTAGHCVSGERESNIRLRSGNKVRGSGTIHTVSAINLHPNYTESTIADNDIAFLTITPAFAIGSTAQPIVLTTEEPVEGDNATISGWGTTSESGSIASIVRKVTVPIIGRSACSEDYGSEEEISGAMICAGLEQGGKDSCSGDSGGPLVVNSKLAGLVSWGYGCAEAGKPGVYTNVALFQQWVQPQIDANNAALRKSSE